MNGIDPGNAHRVALNHLLALHIDPPNPAQRSPRRRVIARHSMCYNHERLGGVVCQATAEERLVAGPGQVEVAAVGIAQAHAACAVVA